MNAADITAELTTLRELLALERAADLEYHRQKIASLPLEERVAEGYAWYPVEVVKSGYTIGSRAFVIVERKAPYTPDQFRAGKTVNLFTRQPNVKQPEKSGIIQYADKGRMKIVLNQQDLPDWLGLGLLGVDLLFDDRTYVEMEKALKQVTAAKGDRLAELRDVLLGRFPGRFQEIDPMMGSSLLNDSQNEALRDALATYELGVIHGPPGTGKTTTLVEVVRRLTETESTVLVTAPSNTAVDLLTERLAEQGLQVLRIGNISRVDESILRHTLEVQLANHPDAKQIKKVKIQAADMRRKARRFKRSFGAEERRERGQMFREAGELSAWANQLEDRLIDHLISGAQVITCTLVGANHPVLEKRTFRTVVIDEAAQALEPATWIPITRASRVILAGDPYQLPPTIKSHEARRGGLEVTLIEKALLRQERTRLLRVQYRMHAAIMGFSNQRFYAGQLLADDSVANHRLPGDEEPPVVFIDTAGAGFEEEVQPAYQSRFNPGEFQILREHLYELLDHWHWQEVAPLPSIALISPYREQVLRMQQAVKEDERLVDVPITINTIDGFQGQERDVVYISLVRSNDKQEIGFLKDYRRMNVAMTRARQKLVIVGDSATIGADDFYASFLAYCEAHGSYRTAWEFMHPS
ncbi:MAG: AAA family ATPase [Lewinella sp.]|nr:AAA family ATPase [Lewinella sp.]